MKRFQTILCAGLLTLAMSSATFAGNIYGRAGNIYGSPNDPTATAPGNIYGSPNGGNIYGLANETINTLLGLFAGVIS
jgi:hypothetical protein